MKMYGVKNKQGKFLRVKNCSGYKQREWVSEVFEASMWRRASDATQTGPVSYGKSVVQEVDVRVKEKLPKTTVR